MNKGKLFVENHFQTSELSETGSFTAAHLLISHVTVWSKAKEARAWSECFTIEEDEEDAGVGELLSTQQVDVLHTQVEGQLDDGTVFHVCGDVRHQSQVLHQPAGLPQQVDKTAYIKPIKPMKLIELPLKCFNPKNTTLCFKIKRKTCIGNRKSTLPTSKSM